MGKSGSRLAYIEWSDAELDRLYDAFPRASWPELLALLPDRSRSAIWQMGKSVLKLSREVNRHPKWTTDEIIILRRIYPSASDAELKTTFARHSFSAIQRQASTLKIMRPRHEARSHGRFVHPIIGVLYKERQWRHLNRVQLGKAVGYAHGQILGWELGKTKPEFAIVCDWAQALGFEIALRKVEKPESIVVAFPDKQRLMGAR